jgi:hypothetical protein
VHERQYDKMQTWEIVLRLFSTCVWIAFAGAIVALVGGAVDFSTIQVTGVLVTQVGITTGMLLIVSLVALSLASVLGLVRNSNPAAVEIVLPGTSQLAGHQGEARNVKRLARRISPVALLFNLGLTALTFSPLPNGGLTSIVVGLLGVVAVLALMRILTTKVGDPAPPLAK